MGERGVCSALVRALSEIRAPYGATTNENRPFRLLLKAFRPLLPTLRVLLTELSAMATLDLVDCRKGTRK
jgi:hypothetical protein